MRKEKATIVNHSSCYDTNNNPITAHDVHLLRVSNEFYWYGVVMKIIRAETLRC